MNVKVGDQIRTVYGHRFVVKVNAKSVTVKLSEGTIAISNRNVRLGTLSS